MSIVGTSAHLHSKAGQLPAKGVRFDEKALDSDRPAAPLPLVHQQTGLDAAEHDAVRRTFDLKPALTRKEIFGEVRNQAPFELCLLNGPCLLPLQVSFYIIPKVEVKTRKNKWQVSTPASIRLTRTLATMRGASQSGLRATHLRVASAKRVREMLNDKTVVVKDRFGSGAKSAEAAAAAAAAAQAVPATAAGAAPASASSTDAAVALAASTTPAAASAGSGALAAAPASAPAASASSTVAAAPSAPGATAISAAAAPSGSVSAAIAAAAVGAASLAAPPAAFGVLSSATVADQPAGATAAVGATGGTESAGTAGSAAEAASEPPAVAAAATPLKRPRPGVGPETTQRVTFAPPKPDLAQEKVSMQKLHEEMDK
jgi:hypothetical protein